MTYDDALTQARAACPLPFAPGSAAEEAALARFARFFSDFSPAKVASLLDDTYAEHLYFHDTLKFIGSREALREYLGHSAAAVESCVVRIDEVMGNGRGDYYLRWAMRIRFRRFARGRDTDSIGMSHLRFDADGRVIFHQDFWNAAEGLFQYVPLLGWMIRAIQRRL